MLLENETVELAGTDFATYKKLGLFTVCLLTAAALWTETKPQSLQSAITGHIMNATHTTSPMVSISSTVGYQYPSYNISTDQVPLPMQVLQGYMQQHGREAILESIRNNNTDDRHYALAFYSCPHQGGNRLHIFWNGLLWSMLTNRTVLWKYWDKETCLKYTDRLHYRAVKCKKTNTEIDCANVLHRAPWMMSYDEWKQERGHNLDYDDDDDEPFATPYHTTVGGRYGDALRIQTSESAQSQYGVDLLAKYPQRVVHWPHCHFGFHLVASTAENGTSLRDIMLHTSEARTMADQLYSLGADFMYGMFYKYTFDWAKPILQAVSTSVSSMPDENMSQYFTIALHSRHQFAGLDGCNIDREINTLSKAFFAKEQEVAAASDAATNYDKPIRVSIMSDRPCTVSRLTSWLQNRSISSISATHVEETPGYVDEHGPFAGDAFFVDLAVVASTVRDAFIGMGRTSSALLRELITFERTMEAMEQSREVDALRLYLMTAEKDPHVGKETKATSKRNLRLL
ncbi:hypothetical protein MPSEU_000263700 [Mayamaea pseudoterrestris]|nr:hypothetical protein MPSEU_000263700 [Mayamaea pseudoterrestris]